MGWFIAQSLAFIIVAALIGLGIGIWIGWLVWGRRSQGKHTAERVGATERATAASTAGAGSAATTTATAEAGPADDADETDAERADVEPVPALAAVAADPTTESADAEAPGSTDTTPPTGAPGPDAQDEAGDGSEAGAADAAEAAPDAASTAPTAAATSAAGDDIAETEAAVVAEAESAVVAEAEAVARRAAEADAAAQAAQADEPGATAEPTADETPDDLQRIEGIGPKIAKALVAAGYPTYAKIAAATEAELREAVAGQGIKFAPSASTWADQAQYLVDSDTEGLDEYQDYLVGGQERRAKFSEKVDYTDVDEIDGAAAKAAALAADEAAAAAAAATPEPEPEPQDLQRIEGIGPKIEGVLQAAGYTTYARVAAASETELREALATGGITFAPAAASWADQAQYLVDGDEDGLQEYQDYLVGGQERRAKFSEKVDYTDVDEIDGAGAKAAALAADEAKAAAAEGETGTTGTGTTGTGTTEPEVTA